MLNIRIIGRVSTEFPEKFGVPKQPNLVPSLKGVIRFEDEFRDPNFLKGLDKCSHIWVLFHFHLNKEHSGTTIRPPVLGGSQRMGIFSTRSPHRPNPIGLSLLKIDAIDMNKCEVFVSGHDLVDGTPIIDIKPYISAYDFPQEKSFHWSEESESQKLSIKWEAKAMEQLVRLHAQNDRDSIEQILSLDPRPRAKSKESRFGFYYRDLNIVFSGSENEITIQEIIKTN